jgi:hypothetical protein
VVVLDCVEQIRYVGAAELDKHPVAPAGLYVLVDHALNFVTRAKLVRFHMPLHEIAGDFRKSAVFQRGASVIEKPVVGPGRSPSSSSSCWLEAPSPISS